MQHKQLFEYAIIRIVPRVERQEFFNAGVIVYCAAENFLQTKVELDTKKLASFCDQTDIEDLQKRLMAFEKICLADKTAGPISELPPAARFRWLTAVRSTIVQTSPVHPGFSNNLPDTLNRLFDMLVN
jgi:hypothetical protein